MFTSQYFPASVTNEVEPCFTDKPLCCVALIHIQVRSTNNAKWVRDPAQMQYLTQMLKIPRNSSYKTTWKWKLHNAVLIRMFYLFYYYLILWGHSYRTA